MLQNQAKNLHKERQNVKRKLQRVQRQASTAKQDKVQLHAKEQVLTQDLHAVQSDINQAFLSLYEAQKFSDQTESAILDDAEDVLNDMRNVWAAEYLAGKSLGSVDNVLGQRNDLRQTQNKTSHTVKATQAKQARYTARLKELDKGISQANQAVETQTMNIATLKAQLGSFTEVKEKQVVAKTIYRKPQPKPVVVARAKTAPKTKQIPRAKKQNRHGKSDEKFPVRGTVVMKFGQKDALGTKSQGMVFEAGQGQNVVVPRNGTVKFAGAFGKFKQLLIVEHQGGYHSLITGFDEIETKVGDRISAGTVVGHLAQAQAYYEVRHNGVPVDPDRVSF